MELRYVALNTKCHLRKGSEEAAGWDAIANIDSAHTLQPGERFAVPLGVILDLPRGWECQVRSRSGLALKHGIVVLNSPGTIDSDFRGECKAIIANLSSDPFIIETGMRIAQLVFKEVPDVTLVTAEALRPTDRGAGGFGSTGI